MGYISRYGARSNRALEYLPGGGPDVVMRSVAFLAQVQERGEYPDEKEAKQSARVVLALLGAHLVGTERAELAARLPEAYELVLLDPLPATEPLGPEQF